MQRWPTYQELLNTCARYVQQEQGDTNYEVALSWSQQHWDDTQRVAGAVRVLEETWNRAFFSRFGIFSMARLVEALEKNHEHLGYLRLREIDTFAVEDEEVTRVLWGELFEALKPISKPVRPFVATAKALHLLVPTFFVPFDAKIAKHYCCNIDQPRGYIRFQHLMAEFASYTLDSYVAQRGGDHAQARATICDVLYLRKTSSRYTKSLAKMLDEYNWMTILFKVQLNG